MMRQYSPQRHQLEMLGGRLRAVGTIPVGTIVRIGVSPRDMKTRPVLVLAWLPREITAARAGGWSFGRARFCGPTWHPPESRYMANFGHLALCRDLRTGKTELVSDCFLHDDD